jgi:hypothetical protein
MAEECRSNLEDPLASTDTHCFWTTNCEGASSRTKQDSLAEKVRTKIDLRSADLPHIISVYYCRMSNRRLIVGTIAFALAFWAIDQAKTYESLCDGPGMFTQVDPSALRGCISELKASIEALNLRMKIRESEIETLQRRAYAAEKMSDGHTCMLAGILTRMSHPSADLMGQMCLEADRKKP